MKNEKMILFRVPAEEHKALAVATAKDGIKMAHLFRRCVELYTARNTGFLHLLGIIDGEEKEELDTL